jgi:hypothetical protein
MKLKASLQGKGNAIDLLHSAGFHKASHETFASQIMQRVDRLGDFLGNAKKCTVPCARLLGSKGRIHDHCIDALEGQRVYIGADEVHIQV